MKRIALLSETEITDLYSRPDFSQQERELYLTLGADERVILSQYGSIKTRIYFILQFGYFKAKQQFFKFDLADVQSDVEYIISHFFSDTKKVVSGQLSRDYARQQKEEILQLFHYQDWSSSHEDPVERHIGELLRYYPKSQNALRQLLCYFDKQHIVIPSYRIFQDMFTVAYAIEENRRDKLLLGISDNKQKNLLDLIHRNNGISEFNIIRADQKDFHYMAVKDEVDKANALSDLYIFAKDFIPTLKLSKNAIRYYADIAEQYAAFRLRKLRKPQQLLHILCFIYHRYQQIMDNLITSFIYHTRTIREAGKTYAEMAMMEHSAALVVDFPKLAQFLEWFPDRDKALDHEALNCAAYGILPKEQFTTLAKFLKGNTFDKMAAKWEFYLKSSRTFSLYLRPILMAVPFLHYKKNNKLMELIHLLKWHYGSGKNPSQFKLADDFGMTIPKNMLRYLKRQTTDQVVDPYLFEFYVYQKIYHQLDRGTLYCNDSVAYCDIDQDLIDDSLVDNVEEIAAKFGYPNIPIYCDERLEAAIKMLDNAWNITTENIKWGKNHGFHIKKNKTEKEEWSLLYDSSEPLDDAFFKTLPKVELADLLILIENRIGTGNGFTHMKNRYTKRKNPITLAVNACIMSQAFGIGETKMADMSDLNFNLLRSTREDFIRVDTLCTANDMVCNYIHTLPIFKQWNLVDDKLLADADGQKFATSDSTIQSRYSKKYFGRDKGISLYTLIANFVAVNAKNIGLNEYEGHALYDMIYGNKTDIDIDMVTGDNHSLNQLNFIALDAIEVEYVPSIKNIREAADNLYSVKSPDAYSGLLQPKDKINVNRIKSQKRGILRVLLSLIMQENTQSNIIRKLNSHARYARLKAALFEYNRIFNSTHILNLIDNMQLRKVIRTARNRTESYHQLQGFIRKIYHGVFKGKKIVDNRVSAHAARLIANCVIAYNSIILNTLYEKMVKEAEQEIIDQFCRISPIAWMHILFTGRYSFKKSNGDIDVAEMAHSLEMHLRKHFWKPA
jgi:TnpA family transposase